MRRAYIELHLAILLIGFTGLFGKLIAASPAMIVFGRTAISAIAIYCGIRLMRTAPRALTREALPWVLGSGVLLALHWLTFFHAIQVSTVAVGLIGFATFPVFVTFLEPLLYRWPLRAADVLCALLVVAGLLLVAPVADLASATTRGLTWAVASGFLYALLTLLNKRLVTTQSSIRLALTQHTLVALLLLPLVLAAGELPDARTIGWLLALGLACTTLPQILLIHALKTVRAHLVAVATALEPVYGIAFAALLLGEIPDWRTLAGGLVVLGAVTIAMRAQWLGSAQNSA
jgi:drug/metabolite transporter (DMT)-like permease